MAKLKAQRGLPRKGNVGAPPKIKEPATYRSYQMPLRLLAKLKRLARRAPGRYRAEGHTGEVTAPDVLRHAVEQLPEPEDGETKEGAHEPAA